MNGLRAIDALSDRVPTVAAESRPADLLDTEVARRSTHVAVFDEEVFCGLVGMSGLLLAAAQAWIFADLAQAQPTLRIPAQTPLEDVARTLSGAGYDAAAVTDDTGAYLGAVTIDSIGLQLAEGRALAAELGREDLLAALNRGVIVAATDPAGTITEVNDAFCAISKYSRQELVGANHRILNSGVHPKSFWTEMWRTVTAGGVWRGEVCNKAKDGTFYWVDTTISPVRDAAGRIAGYLAVRVDATQRKAAVRKLVESERKARLLHEAVASASRATNVEEVISHCLHSVCRETGWPVGHALLVAPDGQLISSGLWRLPEKHPSVGSGAAFESFRSVTESFRFAPGEGLPGRVLQSGVPLWIADIHQDSNFPRAKVCADLDLRGAFAFPVAIGGRVTAVLEFFHTARMEPDTALMRLTESLGREIGSVIERQRAQTALAESERRTRLVIDTALDAVVAMDARGTVAEWNKQAETIFGWTAAEAVGRPMEELIVSEARRDAYRQEVAPYLGNGEVKATGKRVELSAVRKDGRDITVELAITPVRASGDVCFIAFMRDISEEKAKDAQLVLNQAYSPRPPGNFV
jgi:PAS domain S-box-containing protein